MDDLLLGCDFIKKRSRVKISTGLIPVFPAEIYSTGIATPAHLRQQLDTYKK